MRVLEWLSGARVGSAVAVVGEDEFLAATALEECCRRWGIARRDLEGAELGAGDRLKAKGKGSKEGERARELRAVGLRAAGLLEGGGMLGARQLLLDCGEEFSWGAELTAALQEAVSGGDRVLFRAAKWPSGVPGLVEVVECVPLDSPRARAKWAEMRAPKFEFAGVEEGVFEALGERCDSAAAVDVALRSLSCSLRPGWQLKKKDVERACELEEEGTWVGRHVLTGNFLGVLKALAEGEPLMVLGEVHRTFFRIYCFLQMLEEGVEESEAAALCEVKGRSIKEWRGARSKYGEVALLNMMVCVGRAFGQEIGDWRSIRGKPPWRSSLAHQLHGLNQGRMPGV